MEKDDCDFKIKYKANPRLVNRSKEEILFECLLHIAIKDKIPNVYEIINSLVLGDEYNRSDMVLYINNEPFIFEYDGGYWHDESRILRDIKKTEKLLKFYKESIVVRIRVKCKNEYDYNHPDDRCTIIKVDSSNLIDIVNKTTRILSEKYPSLNSTFKILSKSEIKNAEKLYYNINNICHDNYKIFYELIIKIIGKTNTNKILDKHGYNIRIHQIPKCLEKLKTEYDITGKNMVTFMCDSVASRMDDEKFWEGLEKLKTEYDITSKNMVTFMCGGVASRMDDEKFWEGLEKLKTEYDITSKNMVTIMCDSVASRINHPIFLSELDKIKQGSGYKSISELKRNVSKIPLK